MIVPFILFLFIVTVLATKKLTKRAKAARIEKSLKDKFKKHAMEARETTMNPYVNFVHVENEKPKETEKSHRTRSSEDCATTTTGQGQGELVQRTMARDLRIDYARGVIGQGRYGHVWLADWNEEKVAVKSYFSVHESAWARETDIYQTCMLQHENILGFIASDIKVTEDSVNMLLITSYHPLGSLYDFLRSNPITTKENLFNLVYSTCNGLNHLHTEIVSTIYKPCIVHRDIKSKNILVKSNMECCLSDFDQAER